MRYGLDEDQVPVAMFVFFFFVCETSTPAGRKNELTLNPSTTESFARRPWNTKWGAVGARKAPPKPNPARPPEATATSCAPTVFTENCAIENPETFHNPGGGNLEALKDLLAQQFVDPKRARKT